MSSRDDHDRPSKRRKVARHAHAPLPSDGTESSAAMDSRAPPSASSDDDDVVVMHSSDDAERTHRFRRLVALFGLTTRPGTIYLRPSSLIGRMRGFAPDLPPPRLAASQFLRLDETPGGDERRKHTGGSLARRTRTRRDVDWSVIGRRTTSKVLRKDYSYPSRRSRRKQRTRKESMESKAKTAARLKETKETKETWINARIDFWLDSSRNTLEDGSGLGTFLRKSYGDDLWDFWKAFCDVEPEGGGGKKKSRRKKKKKKKARRLSHSMMVAAIFQRFMTGLGATRREEVRALDAMNTDNVVCAMCNIQIPKDIMVQVFRYFHYGRSLLDTIGLVCWDWYAMMYSSWADKITITKSNVVLIPTIVLKTTTGIVLKGGTTGFPIAATDHLFPLINPKRLRSIEIAARSILSSRLWQLINGMINNGGLFPALRHIKFPNKTNGRPFVYKITLAFIAPNLRVLDDVPCLDWISGLEKLEDLTFCIDQQGDPFSPFKSFKLESLVSPLASCPSLRVCELWESDINTYYPPFSRQPISKTRLDAAIWIPGMCHLLKSVEKLRLVMCDVLTTMTFTSLPKDLVCPHLKHLHITFRNCPPTTSRYRRREEFKPIAFFAPQLRTLIVKDSNQPSPYRTFGVPSVSLDTGPIHSIKPWIKLLKGIMGMGDRAAFFRFIKFLSELAKTIPEARLNGLRFEEFGKRLILDNLSEVDSSNPLLTNIVRCDWLVFLSEICLRDLRPHQGERSPTARQVDQARPEGVQKDQQLFFAQFPNVECHLECWNQWDEASRNSTSQGEAKLLLDLFSGHGFSFTSFEWTSPKGMTVVLKPTQES